MPPTERWPFSPSSPAAVDSLTNRFSSSSFGSRNVTFISERRSLMNVTFRLPNEELEKRFVKESTAAGLDGLKGHRSVGGMRASIYNAFPQEGVDTLVSFMEEFARRNG